MKHKSDFDFCKIKIYTINALKFSIVPYTFQLQKIFDNKILDELCNGNFISTSSILIKKSFIEKYLFDINFPRLQDYDLVLRMASNAKISFTNEVLIKLYSQNDSISSSSLKLKIALNLLLKKKYKLNSIQRKNLTNYIKRIKKKINNN